MKIIVNILLTTIISLSFIACEDKKEFKDTLGIEKEVKVKLEKPKWERRLILADERTEDWFEDADYSEVAATNIGAVYAQNLKDYDKAIKWYLYSNSIKTNSNNLFNIGISYSNIKNYDESIKYYKESFNLGNNKSASNLGLIYKNVFKDYNNAEFWYKKAIERESRYFKKYLFTLFLQFKR
jgi:tetratricopeptide (TPR) repeat protein